ncbi:MAG: DUF362 domain-containing protein [Thermodesulfobacteriota bacterium]
MELDALSVGLTRCPDYDRAKIKAEVERLCAALDFRPSAGTKVLLKPNLVAGTRRDGLPCTQPEFVAAVAEWCLDYGCQVAVGDSPAFGTARMVMRSCGMDAALQGLSVRLVNFSSPQPFTLAHGARVAIAREALECDCLINLPRVKAHGQLLITLAVKNYFGTVVGFRKPLLHARHGDTGAFERMIVDLLPVLPAGITLIDGIVAMHEQGPVKGNPFPVGLIGAAVNPVALDSALLAVLGIDPFLSPIWRECRCRNLPGCDQGHIRYPLFTPAEMQMAGFEVPHHLKPISFHPWHLMKGAAKRLVSRLLFR